MIRQERVAVTIDFTSDTILEFRDRIAKMSNAKLIEYGKACAYMAGLKKSSADGKPVDFLAIARLKERRAEWRRRHPHPAKGRTCSSAIA